MVVLSKESTGTTSGTSRKLWPLVLATVSGSVAAAILVVAYPFVVPGFKKICLPFIPATETQVANVVSALKSLNLNPKCSSVIDLGSGDGRLVLEAAKLGFKSTGVELNPWLVYWSRFVAMRRKIPAEFKRSDLFNVTLSRYNVVIIFGVDSMMSNIEDMVSRENTPFNVIACRFPLPNAVPLSTIGQGIDTVWVYKAPLLLGKS